MTLRHFLLFLTLLCPPMAPAEPDPAISIGSRHTLHSAILDETRELLIYLPNGYHSQTQTRYPLLVVLDGRMNFKLTASTVHSLAEGGAIPRSVIIGVANTDRWRDLTPTASVSIPGTGGGDAFVDFLAEELLPWAEEHFRLTGFRTLTGHSLGGLTSLHALYRTPDAFDAYVALSPSLEWDDGSLTDQWVKASTRGGKHLYLALADEQMERPYYDRLIGHYRRSLPEDTRWTSELFDATDDHMSIRVSAWITGIRWVFGKWRMSSREIMRQTDADVDGFYQQAAAIYKEPRAFGLMDMTNAAYYGLYDPATVDRAMHLFHLATERWPESEYAWSCLGEGLERIGNLREALVIMRKALDMAEENEHFDLPYFQGMVDRVEAALASDAKDQT